MPIRLMLPALTTVTLPPPDSLMPLTVRSLPLVRLMSPLPVLLALNVPTVLALVSVSPLTECVVSVPVVLKTPPVPSVMLPAEVTFNCAGGAADVGVDQHVAAAAGQQRDAAVRSPPSPPH